MYNFFKVYSALISRSKSTATTTTSSTTNTTTTTTISFWVVEFSQKNKIPNNSLDRHPGVKNADFRIF